MSALENWKASCVGSVHVVEALRGGTKFQNGDHSLLLRNGYDKIRRQDVYNAQAALEEAISTAPDMVALRFRRVTKKGDLLAVLSYTLNETDMRDQKFCDALFLRYGIDPPELPPHCDR